MQTVFADFSVFLVFIWGWGPHEKRMVEKGGWGVPPPYNTRHYSHIRVDGFVCRNHRMFPLNAVL